MEPPVRLLLHLRRDTGHSDDETNPARLKRKSAFIRFRFILLRHCRLASEHSCQQQRCSGYLSQVHGWYFLRFSRFYAGRGLSSASFSGAALGECGADGAEAAPNQPAERRKDRQPNEQHRRDLRKEQDRREKTVKADQGSLAYAAHC